MVYLCSLNFYMECKFFESSRRYALEDEINNFIRDKKRVSISMSTTKYGSTIYYSVIVLYKEG